MKLDCQVCGQGVFARTRERVEGSYVWRRSTGYCRQCGYGMRQLEKRLNGKVVYGVTEILAPKKAKGRAE